MKSSKSLLYIIIFLLYSILSFAQNTVGTVLYEGDTSKGFTLFSVHKKTYLINDCGQIINQWDSQYLPGNSAYLLEDGSLLRTGQTESTDIDFGGVGGVIERFNWNGELTWQYFVDTPLLRQHHDIYPMPNGNVLILVAESISKNEAIELGRNPAKLNSDFILNERIIEVEPQNFSEGLVIWEWSFFDHLIQDFDSTKSNYGPISQNPQLVDINFIEEENYSFRWLHINSIQYYEKFDQIVLSSRLLNEFYIIDHSTSIQESASHMGGAYGKGGDFLYRWGNPKSYGMGNDQDQILGGQHYPHFIEDGLNGAGSIILFNNYDNSQRNQSAVLKVNIPQSSPGFYIFDNLNGYLPDSAEKIYSNGTEFFSGILSSAQVLPNGNLLVCEGASGEISEITPADNVVWKYIIPVSSTDGKIASQGENPSTFQNSTFRAIKYDIDYPAFNGKELSPGNPIESNPSIASCLTLSSLETQITDISLYPNPTSGIIDFSSKENFDEIKVYGLQGQLITEFANSKRIDISTLPNGLYILKVKYGNSSRAIKVIKDYTN